MNNIFNPSYNFYQLMPSIFLLEVDGNKDLAHTFLRVQEYYESANDNFRNNSFTLSEYKEWYCSQSKSGKFSYGEDWKGFNVSSSVIEKCYEVNTERTEEDNFFLNIYEKAKKLSKENGSSDFYLLGVRKGDVNTLDHEIAHGLFTTNKSYRIKMEEAISRIPLSVIQPLYDNLLEMGYGVNVHIDEAQAYLSTGLRESQETDELIELTTEFELIFKSFLGDWKLPEPIIKGIVKNSDFKKFEDENKVKANKINPTELTKKFEEILNSIENGSSLTIQDVVKNLKIK